MDKKILCIGALAAALLSSGCATKGPMMIGYGSNHAIDSYAARSRAALTVPLEMAVAPFEAMGQDKNYQISASRTLGYAMGEPAGYANHTNGMPKKISVYDYKPKKRR
jgi:hypothetical protein